MDHIGKRIVQWRTIAGMTQQDLAERVGVRSNYISMIENGLRTPTRRSMIIALAAGLGVSPIDLVGQPTPPKSRDEWEIYRMIPAVRIALDEIPPDDLELWPIERITAGTADVAAGRMACNYSLLADIVPPLLAQTQLLAARSVDGQRLLSRVAGQAAMTIKPFGHVDLAMRLATRAQEAAAAAGDPIDAAFAGYVLAQCTLAGGLRRRSYVTAARCAADLSSDETPDGIAARGMLHLHAAFAGASQNEPDYPAHLDEAAALAARTTADPWMVEFSPDNVALWRVGIALENGVPEKAPGYARAVRRHKLRTVQRRARLHLDWGRGLFQRGETRPAVLQLLEADTISPPEIRLRPTIKEMVGQMVRDQRRASGFPELRELAVRMGVDPLNPADPEF